MPSSIKAALQYLCLCCLCVYPVQSSGVSDELDTLDVIREREVLYASSKRDVEYIFIPWNPPAVTKRSEAVHHGVTKYFKEFSGRIRSHEQGSDNLNLTVFDYIPYNCAQKRCMDADSGSVPRKALILRVADGETSEYVADVVRDGTCFNRIEPVRYSYVRATNNQVSEAPSQVKSELEDVCAKGFMALKPSYSLPDLHGTYVGSRDGRNLTLGFFRGVVMDAKLELDSITQANPFATYVPICDGVISIINRGLDFKSLTLTVLKKSTAYMGVHWVKGRDGDTVLMQRHPLCNMEEHGRRNLSKYQLHKWDQQSPDASILGRRPVERK